MKKKKAFKMTKGEMIFLVVLLIYAAFILIVLLPNYLKNKRKSLYLMTLDYKIKYEKGKWQKITNSDDYKLLESDIYLNGDYFGKYRILISNRFTLSDEDDNVVPYSGYIFAKAGTMKGKFINYSYDEDITSDDDNNIKTALKKLNIGEEAFFNIHEKINIDVNNDGREEKIYVVSNFADSTDSYGGIEMPVANSSGKNFSLVVMSYNNKVIIIDKSISNEAVFDVFALNNIIDINEDNKLELVYSRGSRYTDTEDCYTLYNLTKTKEIYNFCE